LEIVFAATHPPGTLRSIGGLNACRWKIIVAGSGQRPIDFKVCFAVAANKLEDQVRALMPWILAVIIRIGREALHSKNSITRCGLPNRHIAARPMVGFAKTAHPTLRK
jgi:hypothetical protein